MKPSLKGQGNLDSIRVCPRLSNTNQIAPPPRNATEATWQLPVCGSRRPAQCICFRNRVCSRQCVQQAAEQAQSTRGMRMDESVFTFTCPSKDMSWVLSESLVEHVRSLLQVASRGHCSGTRRRAGQDAEFVPPHTIRCAQRRMRWVSRQRACAFLLNSSASASVTYNSERQRHS